mmetsp:Transcript_18025/g.15740  ORF Transcript_18025/g.15740 Transcript_18025/m.15740 type:complete len:89 (+) Transcript_18025:636-902(+)
MVQFDSTTNPTDPRKNQLNFEWEKISKYCEAGFPSAGDDAPYFFWEFDKAGAVDECASTFFGPDCKRRPGHETVDTIRYTSNIDQEEL